MFAPCSGCSSGASGLLPQADCVPPARRHYTALCTLLLNRVEERQQRCYRTRKADFGPSHAHGRCVRPTCSAPPAISESTTNEQTMALKETRTLICTSITAATVEEATNEIQEAEQVGANAAELRLDYLTDLDLEDPLPALRRLLRACQDCGLLSVVTFRPVWEGGRFDGSERHRLAVLKAAAVLGANYVDVELRAADVFFASRGEVPVVTKVILSHHDYRGTPPDAQLRALVAAMAEAGADVAKVATTARDVADAMRMLRLPCGAPCPVIALAMGERGLPSRLLAPRFGGHLTFGALGAGRESAPGQPSVAAMRDLFRLPHQTPATKVFGIVGNPVNHSRSPAIHNAALAATSMDAVYIPYLVDDMRTFLTAFSDEAFAGFSVTIPHKVAALEAAAERDPTAAAIGAANTLVRRPNGGLRAHNTDCFAAIESIERGLAGGETAQPATGAGSPLAGRRVVVVGAGGAGRALAFGALQCGAAVVITNRTLERAQELAADLGRGAKAAALEELAAGSITGDVLANTTAVGMAPHEDETPVPATVLGGFHLVFDAVYTPVETRLLKEAKEQGCLTVTGLDMFIGQAAEQLRLFTGQAAPIEVIRDTVLSTM